MLGVQPLGERCDAVALRSILLPSDSTHGPAAGGSVACVSISRREHTTLSAPGSLQAHDRAGGICACCLREFNLRRCEHPFGLQAVDDPTLNSLPRTYAGPARRDKFSQFFFDSFYFPVFLLFLHVDVKIAVSEYIFVENTNEFGGLITSL